MSETAHADRHQYVIEACALRFDGYMYSDTRPELQANNWWLYDLAQQFVETDTLYANPMENWAAFFSLQRRLGRATIVEARDQRAFLKLFLHLYREPTPAAFIKAEYQQQWEHYDSAQLAATVQWAHKESKSNES
jgi:hypothetical protein